MARLEDLLNYRPRYVVVLGDVPVQPMNVEIQRNNELEQDTANITINEHVLSDVVQNKLMESDENRINVQVWAGYLPDNEKDEFESYTITKKDFYKTFMFQRFEGIIEQPEWQYTANGDTVILQCQDWTSLLAEVNLVDKADGSQCSAAAAISKINSLLNGKMKIEYNSPSDQNIASSTFLGSVSKGKDGKETRTYSFAGKSMWDVVREIVRDCHFDLLKKGRTVYIGVPLSKGDPKAGVNKAFDKQLTKWQFRYGFHFTDLVVRKGQKGAKNKGDIYIELTRTNPVGNKKGKAQKVPAPYIYPPGAKIGNTSEALVINGHYPNKTEAQLKNIAFNIARKLLRKTLTGTIKCQFAFPWLNPDDGLEIYDRDPKFTGPLPDQVSKLQHIEGRQFRIKSLSETMNSDSYQQSIEFELDIPRDLPPDIIQQIKQDNKIKPKKEQKSTKQVKRK